MVEQLKYVLGHEGVGVLGALKGAAVVAQIHADNAKVGLGSPAPGQRLPIVKGTKQAVKNDQEPAGEPIRASWTVGYLRHLATVFESMPWH